MAIKRAMYEAGYPMAYTGNDSRCGGLLYGDYVKVVEQIEPSKPWRNGQTYSGKWALVEHYFDGARYTVPMSMLKARTE